MGTHFFFFLIRIHLDERIESGGRDADDEVLSQGMSDRCELT